jgi:vitamin B12 transporter
LQRRRRSMLRAQSNKCSVVVTVLAMVVWAGNTLAQDNVADGAEGTDTIVVTATRTEEKVEDVASSVTVITAKDIEESQARTAGEALRSVPALDVQNSGPAGGTTSVFIRGAKSEHTLVLVDGMEMSDPISPSRGTDLAHVNVDNVERIEVIRGPQSTLYGSDAIGGVVNIITRQGKDRPGYFAAIEGGSYDSVRVSAGANGKSGIGNYSVTASHYVTEGFSAASEEEAGNVESDGYSNTTLSARFGADVSQAIGVDLFLRYTEACTETDNWGGAYGDDPNNVLDTNQLNVSARGRLGDPAGAFSSKLTLSFNSLVRVNDNPIDTDHPTDFVESTFRGRSLKLDYQGDLKVGEMNTLTFGIESEREAGASDYYSEYYDWYASPPGIAVVDTEFIEKTATTASFYVQDQIRSTDSLNASVGARLDAHDEFGSALTYRGAVAYGLPGETRVRCSAGTGFKTPSLYQLYDGQSGDPDLMPEYSTSWDIGVSKGLPGGTGRVALTYFDSSFSDLIDWEWTGPAWDEGVYRNVGRAESKGVELLASAAVTRNLELAATYTNTRAENLQTGDPLPRRPEHRYTVKATRRFAGRGSVTLAARYVSDRPQSFGPVAEQYALLNVAASYAVSDSISVNGRVDNLLDADYEEVPGYGTPGLSFYVGMKASF